MSHNAESLLDTSSRKDIVYDLQQFAKGFVHMGIESPVNAVLQIGSKAAQSEHIPKLTLTGAPEAGSWAGIAGSMTGAALDFYILNKAAAPVFEKIGLNGISTGAQVGRMALTGAVYEGVFLESNANSKNFLGDRLKAAAIGGGTFAVMGATASAVDKLPLFAVPEARSLMGSISYGVLTGSITGAARSEINSLVKEQRFASPGELLTDTASYAVFGGAFGALNYAQNSYANAMRQKLDGRPRAFESDDSHKVLDIKRDAEGNVVKAVIERPAYQDRSYRMEETLKKMTDGSWDVTAKFIGFNRRARFVVDALAVNQTTDGTLAILRDGGRSYGNYLSVFKPSNQGGYGNFKVDQPGFDPSLIKFNSPAITLDKNGYRQYNKDNTLDRHYQKDGQSASVTYKADGGVAEVRFADPISKKELNFAPEKNGLGWLVREGDYTYSWSGKITAPRESGQRGIIEFKGADGTVQRLDTKVQISDLMNNLRSKMGYADGPTSLPVVNVDKAGNIVMTESTRMYRPVINDVAIEGGKQKLTPGDKIILWEDIGDRGPDVIGRILPWGKTASGVPTLDGKVLTPGSRYQIPMPTEQNHTLNDGHFYRRYHMGIKGEF